MDHQGEVMWYVLTDNGRKPFADYDEAWRYATTAYGEIGVYLIEQ
jgi:hypothetical protein